jgi:flavin reductase (DIM6/NTAB) family NADH-FMN oxidoreductase RutF
MRKAIKSILFGGTLLPQEFTLGLTEPQTDISVWFESGDTSLDVTYRYSIACAAPLTFCIGFDAGRGHAENSPDHLSLKFLERGSQHVLGKIGLKYKDRVSLPDADLLLFQPTNSSNYCLSNAHLAIHYLRFAYGQWRKDNTKGVHLSFLERRAMMVQFIRPHPVALVSLGNEDHGNIFPMNLLGDLGNGYLGMALRTERLAGGLVERCGRVALSSIPLSQGAVAYQLAHNHSKPSFDWGKLPFPVRTSTVFGIPVPAFALRVREVEIKAVRVFGSHSFFAGQIVHEEKLSNDLAFGSIHGFYQSWRLKHGRGAELESSLALDALNKQGRRNPLTG